MQNADLLEKNSEKLYLLHFDFLPAQNREKFYSLLVRLLHACLFKRDSYTREKTKDFVLRERGVFDTNEKIYTSCAALLFAASLVMAIYIRASRRLVDYLGLRRANTKCAWVSVLVSLRGQQPEIISKIDRHTNEIIFLQMMIQFTLCRLI